MPDSRELRREIKMPKAERLSRNAWHVILRRTDRSCDLLSLFRKIETQNASKQRGAYSPRQNDILQRASANRVYISSFVRSILCRNWSCLLSHQPFLVYPDEQIGPPRNAEGPIFNIHI